MGEHVKTLGGWSTQRKEALCPPPQHFILYTSSIGLFLGGVLYNK